jgi:hypothetical protein
MKLTREILRKSGFTDCETTNVTRECGLEHWRLGEDNYISNNDLLITMCKNGVFGVYYKDNVARGLNSVEELQVALKLFKCDNLIKIKKPRNKVKIICYGKASKMEREEAIKYYLKCMLNTEGSEKERYCRIYGQLLEGRDVCTDEC